MIIVIQEKKHKIFKRKGADLFMDKEITLIEALTGLDFVLVHLDGRKVRIQNKSGEVIKPDSVFTCEGLGMPFHKRTYQMGNLFITFKIKFPSSIDDKSATLLKNALTSAPAAVKGGKKAQAAEETIGEVAEVCELKNYTDAHRNTDHRGGDKEHHESDEDEDEDGGHGQGGQKVGCQQQ